MCEQIKSYKVLKGLLEKRDLVNLIKNWYVFKRDFKLFKLDDDYDARLIQLYYPRWYKRYLLLFDKNKDGDIIGVVDTFEFHHWTYTFYEGSDVYILIQNRELE